MLLLMNMEYNRIKYTTPACCGQAFLPSSFEEGRDPVPLDKINRDGKGEVDKHKKNFNPPLKEYRA